MSKQELADKFMGLVNLALDKFHNGVMINAFRAIIAVNCKLNPMWFIEEAGPFFIKFSKQIEAKDIDFFINRDYTNQRNDWLRITKGHGESIAYAFEASVRSSLIDMKDNHREILECVPSSLLRIYAQYLLLCQTADG